MAFNDLPVTLEIGTEIDTLHTGHLLPIHIGVDNEDRVVISGLSRITKGKLVSIEFELSELNETIQRIKEMIK